LGRVWRLVEKQYKESAAGIDPKSFDQNDRDLERERNFCIKKVTGDISNGFKFNTAISQLMILVNKIEKYQAGGDVQQSLLNKAIETVIVLISPFTPHIAEELSQKMGINKDSIVNVPWPDFDETSLKKDVIEFVIQINGKVRSKVHIEPDLDEQRLREVVLADEKVQKHLKGQPLKRFIVVPNKLVNIVI